MSLALSLPAASNSETQTRRLRLPHRHRGCLQWTQKCHSGLAMSQNDEKKDGTVGYGVEPRNLPPGGEGRIYGAIALPARGLTPPR